MLQRQSFQNFESKIKASESAIEFLKAIDLTDLEYFMYSDGLINITDLSSEIGKYEVKVQSHCYDLLPCIKVKIKNDVSLGDIYCETKITSCVGEKLKTVYQCFEEIIKFTDYKITKKVILKKLETGYELSIETNENGVEEHFTRFFSNSMMRGYVSMGSSILLHRLLVSLGVPDNFTIIVFNQYWELTSASYNVLDNLKLKFRNDKVDVCGIERVLYSSEDYEVIWQMYFVPDGHLMSKVQVGSPISMKVKEQPDYIEKDTFMEKATFSMPEVVWEDDMQLVSHFLDLKEAKKSKSMKYLKDHPDIKMILKDFMQTILIRKPIDPVEFASQYFVTFSSRVKSDYNCLNSNRTSLDFLL